MTLSQTLEKIAPPNRAAMQRAKERQAQLAKPPGSLGRLEDFSVQLAGICGSLDISAERGQLLVFAADNGVVCEGVASAPQSVTLHQTINLTRAKTGASALCRFFGCAITVCDVGVNGEIGESAVLNRKLSYGTGNIARGPAMTRETALAAIQVGIELAETSDADVLGVGEMGIGNTTTSSAVLAALTGAAVEEVTGRGGGLTDAAFARKKEVIARALKINRPRRDDVLDVLSKVGGLDLCAMCGAFLGAAAAKRPVVIDGFISAVAALCAARLCPVAAAYFIPSHASEECGYRLAMQALGLKPALLLNMRLGEGSGFPLMLQILRASCAILHNMATFSEAQIDDGYLNELRKESKA